jgi:hypothetical protein
MPPAAPTANIQLRLRGEAIIDRGNRQCALAPRPAALLALSTVAA